MNDSELLYLLALQHVPNIGDASAKKLLHHVGSAEGIFKEKKSNLLRIDGIGEARIKDLFDPVHRNAATAELSYIKEHTVDVSYFMDSTYPENLKHCLDGPLLLFSRGNINLNNSKVISVVGTRKVTSHGIDFCNRLMEELGPVNPIIVSGFAYGVDITAHKAAIKNNLQTIGCLAHGLNQIYPKTHQKYTIQVEENGGFYTDFWSSDEFERNNFLKRNRIIAGISQATIVIESAEKGGSLVTAEIANSYNRDVFAVPGRTSDSQSKGCNNLIKQQKAHLLTSAADLVYMLGWQLDEKPAVQKSLFVELDAEEKAVYGVLKEGKLHLDQIALNTDIAGYKIASILLNMELNGLVRPLPGKLFELI
ncbi:DNA-processing protein DprA [Gangjinia marincola]|uniref:DNA-processing protein DprA n=1 Tax=Gangjinia marincola TaxID=578463 RepID=A0ABP3XTR2_9FLAO